VAAEPVEQEFSSGRLTACDCGAGRHDASLCDHGLGVFGEPADRLTDEPRRSGHDRQYWQRQRGELIKPLSPVALPLPLHIVR